MSDDKICYLRMISSLYNMTWKLEKFFPTDFMYQEK